MFKKMYIVRTTYEQTETDLKRVKELLYIKMKSIQ